MKKQKALGYGIVVLATVANTLVGAGTAHIGVAGSKACAAVETLMISGIGRTVGKPITKTLVKSTATSNSASKLGKTLSMATVGHIPVAGRVVNAVIAGTITLSLGCGIVKEYNE